MSQGLREPSLYDVDNDNDGVPDAEDTDDDNNGILDVDQALLPGCFWGEEESPFDHDNDGIVDWADVIGMPTAFQTTLNLPSASLPHSITTTMAPVTTSIRTTTKME